jgi:hypothetical protein
MVGSGDNTSQPWLIQFGENRFGAAAAVPSFNYDEKGTAATFRFWRVALAGRMQSIPDGPVAVIRCCTLPEIDTQASTGHGCVPRRSGCFRLWVSRISTYIRHWLPEQPTSLWSVMAIFRCLPGSDGTETEQGWSLGRHNAYLVAVHNVG